MAYKKLERNFYQRSEICKDGSISKNYYLNFTDWKGIRRKVPLGSNLANAKGQKSVILALNYLNHDFDKPRPNKEVTEKILLSGLYRDFTSPIVYLIKHGEEILYIGKSGAGVSRPFTPKHHAICGLLPSDAEIEIIQYATDDEAVMEERKLIHKHQPKFNKVGIFRN